MSLVSYGASSSSEESDTEEEVAQVNTKEKVKPLQKPTSQKKSLFSTLPPPKTSSNVLPPQKSSLTSDPPEKSQRGTQKKSSLFSSLPPPKSSGTLQGRSTSKAATGNANTPSLSVSSLNLPPPKKKSQPVKISLPSLPDPDSDEDDEPISKKPKPAQGVAGLFAQLPKPKHATAKEANRILIPHTLTKKKPAAPAKSVAPKKVPASNTSQTKGVASLVKDYDDEEEEDDDENESDGFFSLHKKDTVKPIMPETSSLSSSSSSLTSSAKVLVKISQEPRTTKEAKTPSDIIKSNQTELPKSANMVASETDSHDKPSESTSGTAQVAESEPSSDTSNAPLNFKSPSQDAPLNFRPGSASGYGSTGSSDPNAPLSFHSGSQEQYGYYQQATGSGYTTGQPDTNYAYQYGAYNQPYTGESNDQTVEGNESTQEPQQQQQQQQKQENYWEDQGFQRMMGKRKRDKGVIDIIDVNADEQLGPVTGTEWLQKSMTEEKEYRGKLKKEQLPSSQQRRKHQITYLAHQAKERELELKNQWANNRRTRKETQAKYGF